MAKKQVAKTTKTKTRRPIRSKSSLKNIIQPYLRPWVVFGGIIIAAVIFSYITQISHAWSPFVDILVSPSAIAHVPAGGQIQRFTLSALIRLNQNTQETRVITGGNSVVYTMKIVSGGNKYGTTRQIANDLIEFKSSDVSGKTVIQVTGTITGAYGSQPVIPRPDNPTLSDPSGATGGVSPIKPPPSRPDTVAGPQPGDSEFVNINIFTDKLQAIDPNTLIQSVDIARSPDTATIYMGRTQKFTITAKDQQGNQINPRDIEWRFSLKHPSFYNGNQFGKITLGLFAGQAVPNQFNFQSFAKVGKAQVMVLMKYPKLNGPVITRTIDITITSDLPPTPPWFYNDVDGGKGLAGGFEIITPDPEIDRPPTGKYPIIYLNDDNQVTVRLHLKPTFNGQYGTYLGAHYKISYQQFDITKFQYALYPSGRYGKCTVGVSSGAGFSYSLPSITKLTLVTKIDNYTGDFRFTLPESSPYSSLYWRIGMDGIKFHPIIDSTTRFEDSISHDFGLSDCGTLFEKNLWSDFSQYGPSNLFIIDNPPIPTPPVSTPVFTTSIAPTSISIEVNKTVQLTATLLKNDNPVPLSDISYRWVFADEASSRLGKFTTSLFSPGKANFTGTSPGFAMVKAEINYPGRTFTTKTVGISIITPPPVDTFVAAVVPSYSTTTIGKPVNLTAKFRKNNTDIPPSNISDYKWVFESNLFASVGSISDKGSGKATFTATQAGTTRIYVKLKYQGKTYTSMRIEIRILSEAEANATPEDIQAQPTLTSFRVLDGNQMRITGKHLITGDKPAKDESIRVFYDKPTWFPGYTVITTKTYTNEQFSGSSNEIRIRDYTKVGNSFLLDMVNRVEFKSPRIIVTPRFSTPNTVYTGNKTFS